MKYLSRIVLCIAALGFTQVFAQEKIRDVPGTVQSEPMLTRYDLDFPGGTPWQLVAAIQKASGRPLNAVINPEDANCQLPSLKMTGVTTPALFEALRESSERVKFVGNNYSNSLFGFTASQIRFKGAQRAVDIISDDTVWYFRVEGSPLPQKDSRFFLLTPYLEQGLTVDDITTAIQTAWKLRGVTPAPVLNYHKETKLLIGVGYLGELSTVEDVLRALSPQKAKSATSSDQKPAATDTKPKS